MKKLRDMTDVEVLMMDGCTKSEAEKHLQRGTIIYRDFEEHFNDYMEEMGFDLSESGDGDDGDDNELLERYREMVRTHKPIEDWGVVEDGEDDESDGSKKETYYIGYAL